MWTSVLVPVTLGMGGGGGGWQCYISLTHSIPVNVQSPLSHKYSALSMGVQAGWAEASLARANC